MDSDMTRDLLRRLGAEFGHKFTSTMPTAEARESAVAVWSERLSGLSFEEIQTGVSRLSDYAKRNNGWPPGAAEFRELCQPHREPYERVEFQRRALPHKSERASKEFALDQIAKLRGKVGGDV